MSREDVSHRASQPLWRVIRNVAVATLVWIVVLEALAQGVVALRPSLVERADDRVHADSYADAAWAEAYYREFAEANHARWQPYTYWRRKPYAGRYINVGEDGLRKTWQDSSSTGRRPFTIFMFGGSTMWGTGVRDDHTVPSALAQLLATATAQDVRVVNYGETGYVSSQEVIALQRALARGDVPDLAIFYDGVNDVYSAFQNAEAGLPENEANRRVEFNVSNAYEHRTGWLFRTMLQHLGESSALVRLVERPYFDLVVKDQRRRALQARAARVDTAALSRRVVDVYRANAEAAAAIAARSGFRTLFYWQPVIYLGKPLTAYEQQKADERDELRPLFLATYRRIADSNLEDAVPFADVSGLFDEDVHPVYLDFCHVSEAANARIARRLAGDVLPIVDAAAPATSVRPEQP